MIVRCPSQSCEISHFNKIHCLKTEQAPQSPVSLITIVQCWMFSTGLSTDFGDSYVLSAFQPIIGTSPHSVLRRRYQNSPPAAASHPIGSGVDRGYGRRVARYPLGAAGLSVVKI